MSPVAIRSMWLISDHSNPDRPFMVVAGSGRFYVDEVSSEVHLELRSGDIHFAKYLAEISESPHVVG